VNAAVPGTPVIGFPRGSGPLAERYAKETGVDAVGCDTSMPLRWIKANLQSLVPVQGNLDPLLLVDGGPAFGARVRSILATLGQGPFIFNLGHGILPETPIPHVERLLDLVKGRSS
jgi:uroporphyrinogen decarboxylase